MVSDGEQQTRRECVVSSCDSANDHVESAGSDAENCRRIERESMISRTNKKQAMTNYITPKTLCMVITM